MIAHGRVPRVLLRDPAISIQAKALYCLLDDHASPDSPRPFPGQGELAKQLGVSERTVRTWTRELVAAGWIEVEQRGLGQNNSYTMRKESPA